MPRSACGGPRRASAALDDTQRARAMARESAEVERLTASKDLEQVVREASSASALVAEALRTEIAELRADAEAVEAEAQGSPRRRLPRSRRRPRAWRRRSRSCWLGSRPTRRTRPGRSQVFLDAQVELAALAGRIDTVQSDLARNQVDGGEAQERIRSGEERLRDAPGTSGGRCRRSAAGSTRVPRRSARERDETEAVARAAAEAVREQTEAVTRAGDDLRGDRGRAPPGDAGGAGARDPPGGAPGPAPGPGGRRAASLRGGAGRAPAGPRTRARPRGAAGPAGGGRAADHRPRARSTSSRTRSTGSWTSGSDSCGPSTTTCPRRSATWRRRCAG